MSAQINIQLTKLLTQAGVTGDIVFTTPPNPEMGDVAFACFGLSKEWKKSPVEIAKGIASTVDSRQSTVVEKVEAVGPYINFYLKGSEVAAVVLKDIAKQKAKYGTHKSGDRKKVMVEYGCPNPLKSFHLGHLRNLVTGESVARVLENSGFRVLRVNYQGDVGMHVAKTLWGLHQNVEFRIQNSELTVKNFNEAKKLSLSQRIAYLGAAYAYGAQAFETDKKVAAEIGEYNRRVYEKDSSIEAMYATTRKWSLDYFQTIYKKLGTAYDVYYFESAMYKRALRLVAEFLTKAIFVESEGAVIFAGSTYGLHDRVFVNSKGFPTYEAKDLALSEARFKKYHPSRIIHVVGKEQTEYFRVIFKALEFVVPESKDKEFHLVGGYLQLKGEQKMSSRTGNVITGDALIEQVRRSVDEIVAGTEIKKEVKKQQQTKDRVAVAALKYAMLKTGVSDDIAFDMAESVSLSGDSGPYLLYIVARIRSILRKSKIKNQKSKLLPTVVEPAEKQLLLKLAEYPEATKLAAEKLDPSYVAKYLFDLAQAFNTFYHACPVIQAEPQVRQFRLQLIAAVETVMVQGLNLLGIETVESM